MFKISIPKPCHEDWSEMSPNEQGRHCNACAKTVVDFTAMSDDQVKNFFINKKEERVCGRFQQKQLDQLVIDLPSNIFRIDMPLWKKFLVASLVVFSTTLFSCNTSIDGQLTGEPIELLKNTSNKLEPGSNGMVGMLMVNFPDTTKPGVQDPNTVKGGMVVTYEEPTIKGDIEMLPDTSKPKKCNQPLMGDTVFIETKTDTVVHLMGKPSVQNVKGDRTIVGELKVQVPLKGNEKDCDKKIYQ